MYKDKWQPIYQLSTDDEASYYLNYDRSNKKKGSHTFHHKSRKSRKSRSKHKKSVGGRLTET